MAARTNICRLGNPSLEFDCPLPFKEYGACIVLYAKAEEMFLFASDPLTKKARKLCSWNEENLAKHNEA